MLAPIASKSLIKAAKDGDSHSVINLIQSKTCIIDDADEYGKTALQWAAKFGHVTVVRLLIEAGAQVDNQDSKGLTPLHDAAAFGRSESVRLLIQLGLANPNLKTYSWGNSPLHLAAEKGYNEVVRWILASGQADCNLQTSDGRSAVHKAARLGRAKSLELLLLAGADPDLRAKDGSTPLHHAALSNDDGQCVRKLLQVGGANPDALDNFGFSPLHHAACSGQRQAVQFLLSSGCQAVARTRPGVTVLSPAELAAGFHQDEVLLELVCHCNSNNDFRRDLECSFRSNISDFFKRPEIIDQISSIREAEQLSYKTEFQSEEELSQDLHSAMEHSGFNSSRASVQAAISDVLQSICRERWGPNNHIVGSYADGWGNSLSRLNGVTDADADIDLTCILDQKLHLDGVCRCSDSGDVELVAYVNGHARCSGIECNPAVEFSASAIRPAVDIIRARASCQYPRIPLLEKGYKSQISLSVLDALRQELVESPCHLVTAAPPGQNGLLRVSTSFLERRLMRSLTSLQGQTFLLIKYLLKRVLSHRVAGVKTYHAKTLIFYLLDETPESEWLPNRLVSIARTGLEKLLNGLQENPRESDQCMRHFFLRDAWLYLKKGHGGKAAIANELRNLIAQLPQLVRQFKDNLRPIGEEGVFNFHPFLVIPESRPRCLPKSGRLRYHNLPDLLAEILVKLSQNNCSEILKAELLRSAVGIPGYAETARNCLLVLTYLKFNMIDEAKELLREAVKHKPNEGLSGQNLTSSTAESVRQHLESSDSAWKFCFWFDSSPPNLDFLPESVKRTRRHFPTKMQLAQMNFINFAALLRCLSLELGLVDQGTGRQWFEESLESDTTDAQQLLMSMEFCSDRSLLAKLIAKHRDTVCDLRVTRIKTIELLNSDPILLDLCAQQTLEIVAKKLSHCL